jgi:DNA-binding transcriptional regulator YiaG
MLIDIKSLRQKLGLTQRTLAIELGVTIRSITNWESGKPINARIEKRLQKMEERITRNEK